MGLPARMPHPRLLILSPSPARQRVYKIERLRPGAVNRAQQVWDCYSGKALNAARILQQIGAAATVLSFAPEEEHSRIKAAFALHRWRLIPVSTPIRICTTLLEPDRASELVENQAKVGRRAATAFRHAAFELAEKCDAVLATGSLPPDMSPEFYTELSKRCRQAGVFLIADAHGAALKAFLERPPALLKPNLEELWAAFHKGVLPASEPRIRSFLIRVGLDIYPDGEGRILASAGARGAWLATQGSVSLIPAPRVRVLNSVGSGDTMAGLLTLCGTLGLAPRPSARLAVAAASWQCATPLPGLLPEEKAAVLRRGLKRFL